MKISGEGRFCIILTSFLIILFSGIALIASRYLSEEINIILWLRVSDLGTEAFYIVIGLAIYYLYNPYVGFATILSLVLSGSLNSFLKEFFAMPRPPNPKVPAEGYGFPSGHAQNTTVFWGTLTLLSRSACLLLLSVFLVAIVSYSRVFLGVHYIHDVVGGVFIGLVLVSAMYYAVLRIKSIITRDITLIIISILFSLLSYLYTRDLTVLKLSAVSLGASMHLLVFTRRNYVNVERRFSRRMIGFATSLVVVFAILYSTRSLALTSAVVTYVIYSVVGLLIPSIYLIITRVIR